MLKSMNKKLFGGTVVSILINQSGQDLESREIKIKRAKVSEKQKYISYAHITDFYEVPAS